MYLLTSKEMRLLDELSIHKYGISSKCLMENAGKQVFKIIQGRFSPLKGKKVLIFCGPGNNGGDGLVVARCLKHIGARVHVVHDPFKKRCQPDLIVDALFGTGLSRELTKTYRETIQWINHQSCPRISVDIPSGMSADTGKPQGACVRADLTVTFGFPKRGFFSPNAAIYLGELNVVPIGLSPKAVKELKPQTHLITREEIKLFLKPRKKNSHKGSFGHVFVIGGSEGKIGAGVMAAHTALLAGAGLSTLVCPTNALKKIDPKALEIMYEPLKKWELDPVFVLLKKAAVVALGPGLGTNPGTVSFVRDLVKTYKGSLIIDADGLNALAADPSILNERKGAFLTFLTPHPAEMGRLVQKTARHVQANRLNVASNFSKKYGVFVLLKGYRSIVAMPDGAVWVNPTGNAAMATAGQGDVLTGVYAGLMAQYTGCQETLLFGCFLHGLVGDLLAGIVPGEKLKMHPQRVVLATDIARNLDLGYSFLKKKSDVLRKVFY